MGLDLELFEGEVPEDLVCGLCRKVVVNPIQSRGEDGRCTHLFCRACLRRSEDKATCPTCGVSLKATRGKVNISSNSNGTGNGRARVGAAAAAAAAAAVAVGAQQQQPSVDVKVKLLGLVVRCSHKCGKVCTLAELPDHVGDECPNAPVPCSHVRRGCKMTVKRSEQQEHAEECDYRPVQCEACGQRTIYLDLFTHQSRKRCLEKKLRQQLIRAVRITNTEVKLHRRYLEQQTLRLDLQQRQRLMDHHRQTTAVAKAQRHHNHTKMISGSGCGGGGNSSSSCYGSELETPSVVSTQIVSFDPHHPAPPTTRDVVPTTRDVFLTSSKTVMGEVGEEEEEGSEKAVTLHTTPSPSRLSGGTVSTCRNCKRQFRENLNSPTACRWHPGTCYSCGRLDYQKGCMMGCHEL